MVLNGTGRPLGRKKYSIIVCLKTQVIHKSNFFMLVLSDFPNSESF
jgi:hypothetical protein